MMRKILFAAVLSVLVISMYGYAYQIVTQTGEGSREEESVDPKGIASIDPTGGEDSIIITLNDGTKIATNQAGYDEFTQTGTITRTDATVGTTTIKPDGSIEVYVSPATYDEFGVKTAPSLYAQDGVIIITADGTIPQTSEAENAMIIIAIKTSEVLGLSTAIQPIDSRVDSAVAQLAGSNDPSTDLKNALAQQGITTISESDLNRIIEYTQTVFFL